MHAIDFWTWTRRSSSISRGGPSCAECQGLFQDSQEVALASENAASEGIHVHNTERCNPEGQPVVGTFRNGKLVLIPGTVPATPTPVPTGIINVSYA